MLEALLTLFIGLIFLVLGAHLLIKGASTLALLLRVTPAVIGLTIVAIGTSLPELFVGLQATFSSAPALLMGNLVGSNLLNIGLVVGLSSLILPITVERQAIRIEWPIMFGLTVLVCFFLWNKTVTQFEGLLLLLLTVGVTSYFFYLGRQHHDASTDESKEALEKLKSQVEHRSQPLTIGLCGVYLIAGFILLRYGSIFFINGASTLSQIWNISDRVIGITIVAIGTSLPELAISLVATFKGRSDIALSNIIGSNIFNIAGILGVCSLIKPTVIPSQFLTYDLPWLLVVSFLLFLVILKGQKINRWKSAILLLSYVIYTATLF